MDDVAAGHAGHLGRHVDGDAGRLGRDPQVHLAVLDLRGAVDRLHRRMGQERRAVFGGDLLQRLHLLAVDLAAGVVGVARLGVEQARQAGIHLGTGQIRLRARPPLRRQGGRRLSRAPPGIGDNRRARHAVLAQGRRQVQHFLDARHGQRHRRIERGQGIAQAARQMQGRVQHAGRPRIDAEHGAAIDFRRRVRARGSLADQLEVQRRFQHRRARVQRAGALRQAGVAGAPAVKRAPLRRSRCGIATLAFATAPRRPPPAWRARRRRPRASAASHP